MTTDQPLAETPATPESTARLVPLGCKTITKGSFEVFEVRLPFAGMWSELDSPMVGGDLHSLDEVAIVGIILDGQHQLVRQPFVSNYQMGRDRKFLSGVRLERGVLVQLRLVNLGSGPATATVGVFLIPLEVCDAE